MVRTGWYGIVWAMMLVALATARHCPGAEIVSAEGGEQSLGGDADSASIDSQASLPGGLDPCSCFYFNGPMSPAVLDRYLSRAMTMSDMLLGRGDLEDHIRMVTGVGAKLCGRVVFLWGQESQVDSILSTAEDGAAIVHQADPEIILQAAFFEYVSRDVEAVSIPEWVFEGVGVTSESRCFDYDAMQFPSGNPNHDLWGNYATIPDMSRLESRLWLYYLACRYIDIGIEAIHLGQMEWMSERDEDKALLEDLLGRIRAYAADHARRGVVLLDCHTHGGMVRQGRLLLDFHSAPLRLTMVEGQPESAIPIMEHCNGVYGQSLYGQSNGGVHPMGWSCDANPYLVEFDHGYSQGSAVENTGPEFLWGYDEITWFARQSQSDREAFLSMMQEWLGTNDPNGHLQMPGQRMIYCNHAEHPEQWYCANNISDASPNGYNMESAIYDLWHCELTTSVTAGQGRLLPATRTEYGIGELVTLTAEPNGHSAVAGWQGTDDDSSTATTNTVSMDADRSVSVWFEAVEPNRVLLSTAVTAGRGTITPSAGEYEQGTVVTLAAEPDPNYVLRGWSGSDDDSSASLVNAVTMTTAKTVGVAFEPNEYRLTTEVLSGVGTLSPATGWQTTGSEVTVTARAEAGWQVCQWTGTADDLSLSSTNCVVMDQPRTVGVRFERVPPISLDILSGRVIDGPARRSDLLMARVDFPTSAAVLAEAGYLQIAVENTGAGVTVPFSLASVHGGRFLAMDNGAMVVIDFSRDRLDLQMMGVELAGLRSPLQLRLGSGLYSAVAQADATTVSVPVTLLSGIADALGVTARPVVVGEMVMLQCQLVRAEPVTPVAEWLSFSLDWGQQPYSLPAGSFRSVGSQSIALNAEMTGGGTAMVMMDHTSGRLLIVMRGVHVEPRSGVIPIGVTMGSFSEQAELLLP